MEPGLYVLGCDIGSLTAKAVMASGDRIVASRVVSVDRAPLDIAQHVMGLILGDADVQPEDLAATCATGYGRLDIPFGTMQASEISCHGLGAHLLDQTVRTVIDIGGQDAKVIKLDDHGNVVRYAMNDRCAASAGACLELLARRLEVSVAELGALACGARGEIEINNRCLVDIELDVLDLVYRGTQRNEVAWAICDALARRVATLVGHVGLEREVCITGGVSKCQGVVQRLQELLGVKFRRLPFDPQLVGALGATALAQRSVV